MTGRERLATVQSRRKGLMTVQHFIDARKLVGEIVSEEWAALHIQAEHANLDYLEAAARMAIELEEVAEKHRPGIETALSVLTDLRERRNAAAVRIPGRNQPREERDAQPEQPTNDVQQVSGTDVSGLHGEGEVPDV